MLGNQSSVHFLCIPFQYRKDHKPTVLFLTTKYQHRKVVDHQNLSYNRFKLGKFLQSDHLLLHQQRLVLQFYYHLHNSSQNRIGCTLHQRNNFLVDLESTQIVILHSNKTHLDSLYLE